MLNLSERLLTIAEMIEKGETVADIGTDHGYLPIYLLLEEKIPSAVLTDISGGSLGKAKINCAEYLSEQSISLREGDGLEVISPGEVDTVVMAGIGGLLIKEILDWDLYKSKSFKKLILQPRNNGGALRKFLKLKGFNIDELRIVPEGERFSEIMLVRPTSINTIENNSFDNHDDAVWEFPDDILSDKNTCAREYLEKCLEQERKVLEKIMLGISEKESNSAEKDILYRKSRIKRLEDLLTRV